MSEIKKVAVIGAGVMGAAIAAHVANAGVPVILLDIVPKDATNRSVIAESAVEKMLRTDPAPFMSKGAARLVTTGNTEDHFDLLKDCDWIIEAVIERLDIKQALYARIDKVKKKGCVVSSNTSTIPLVELTKGASEEFAKSFLITHFFNPPRYMRLLEVVTSNKTSKEALAAVSQFADMQLGKSIVVCKDRPGFIGNRLGIYWMQVAVTEAIAQGITVEEADAILSKPIGVPKTGVFGLIDLVGLDLMPHINASMTSLLPKEDPFHAANQPMPLIERMIKEGYTGRKGKGGFYRLNREKGKRKEAIDLTTGDYRDQQRPSIDAINESGRSLAKLLSHDSKHGKYAWDVMSRTLAYAASLVGEVSDDPSAIDEAMRLGFNWKFGPFELIDQLGTEWLSKNLQPAPKYLQIAAGRSLYRIENGHRQVLGLDGAYHDVKRSEGVIMLEDIKRTAQPVLKNGSAAVWDIGDGVACFEFTSKMNSLDADTMALISKTIKLVQKDFKALVIYNEGTHFSAGANLGLAAFAANIAAWGEIERLVASGQDAYRALKYAPFPVVSAPSGMALGGGCEILLASDAVQAHAETYTGLVEVGVGLIPGWGGCKEMLHRWGTLGKLPQGPMPAVIKAFEIISVATVSKSAAEAKEYLFMRPGDSITMNRYRLLADAKAKALALSVDYKAPEPPTFNLPGPTGRVAMDMAVDGFARAGKATPYDKVVLAELAEVLSGGKTDMLKSMKDTEILELERTRFMQLVRNTGTLDRITQMLETGKPLRN
ncbi:3-hydroxyacyl-CoA dehydrogenase/enoyl-CoA hydratase family protein [Aestuariivirga litoralis]|uniref:3-hydroxyacyl-CoA dehydrogenase/enoyl-CoA hydratase family protein n=1 Tax=Aestuariivirga litoralis TaxID=2650924 RepID=UPI0018C54E68|nr:3-hydroxyacyl-CoA dehydrogenase/enoyl-CoA hydratase family protein [Aestuariivirga litoralis]MBG1232587.1 3-hydroxyacyl-CoA dehydrogenase [Aestuariivirga litoralis]